MQDTFRGLREEEQHGRASVGRLRLQFNQHWVIKSCRNVAWSDEPPHLQLHIYFHLTFDFDSTSLHSHYASDISHKKNRTQQFESLFFLLGAFQRFSPSIIKSIGPVVDPRRYAVPWRVFEFDKRRRER